MNDITIRLFFFSRDDKNYITSNPTLYSCAQTYVTVLYRTPMIDSMYKKNHRWDRPRSLIHWNIAVLFKSPHGGGGGRPIMIICQIKKRYIYISISRACAVVLEETEEEEEGDVVFLVGLGCFCTERDRYGGGTVWVRRGRTADSEQVHHPRWMFPGFLSSPLSGLKQ